MKRGGISMEPNGVEFTDLPLNIKDARQPSDRQGEVG